VEKNKKKKKKKGGKKKKKKKCSKVTGRGQKKRNPKGGKKIESWNPPGRKLEKKKDKLRKTDCKTHQKKKE